jgi:hypothetical protein
MKLKSFKESISGWELVGRDMGPNYPQQKNQITLSTDDTSVILGMDGNIYNEDRFLDLYNLYLKSGGKEPLSDFNKTNLDKLLNMFL